MTYNEVTSEKFAEDLYFLLMASPIRARVQTLGARYGLTPAALRNEIIRLAAAAGRKPTLSTQQEGSSPRRNAG